MQMKFSRMEKKINGSNIGSNTETVDGLGSVPPGGPDVLGRFFPTLF